MQDVIPIKSLTDNPTFDIVLDTIERNKQIIVFVGSKSSAEKTAEEIAQYIKKNKIAVPHDCKPLSEQILHTLSKPTKQCERESRCVEQSIAFHHAGLLQKQKTAIENGFRDGIIKCICCTPTLCLAKDTNLWHGLKETPVSVYNSNNALFVLDKNKFVPICPTLIQKMENNASLIEITSVAGYSIRITPKHKMLIKRGGKRKLIPAKNVKEGDKIATIGKINLSAWTKPLLSDFVKDNNLPVIDQELDSAFLYFIGAMLGDGYSGAEIINDFIKYKGSPCIVGKDDEIFIKIEEFCKQLNISCKRKKSLSGVPQLILGKNKWFREFLVRTGVEKGEKKHISEKIINMSRDNCVWLLRGLFDTDGWVEKKQGGIGFCNISEKLVKQIQKLLLLFGIVSHIRKRPASIMKIYEKEYKTKPCFELTIVQKKCIIDFYRFIGFFVKRKQEVLLEKISKIASNLHYVFCNHCNYKIYRDIFSGRNSEQKKWGAEKKAVIMLLGKKGELGSKEIQKRLGFIGRKKELRLNHHYQLIHKQRRGTRSISEWYWSLNNLGQWIYENILTKEKNIVEFFKRRNCPLCNQELSWIIKKGWRASDFDEEIFWDIVRKVESKNVETEVYDVVLPSRPENDHLFVAEGFIVHNSMGVDLPAYRTIIRDLKRFSKNWGQTSISVLEYHQMAGRAGRPGKDTRGEAITIAKTEAEKDAIYEEFVTGEVEDIYSKLAVEPVLRTYLLSLIATEQVRSKQQIVEFFSKTFWAFQYKDMQRLEKIINKMLALLEDFEFVESNKGDFTTALEYANESYKATTVGKRVAELYLDPLTAHKVIEGMKQATQKSLFCSFTLLHLFCVQLEVRPLLNVKKAEYEDIEKQLLQFAEQLLVDAPTEYDGEYDEFLKSIKTALFFETWIQEATEEELLKKFDVRPGELYAKKERLDWLIYAAAELAKLLQLRTMEKEFQKLRIRVEQGVKEELFVLLKFEGVGRVRARKLYDNKIKDVGDVKKIDLVALTQLLGPALAVSLKKQVGIDVQKIPVKENKRKGQISLMDY